MRLRVLAQLALFVAGLAIALQANQALSQTNTAYTTAEIEQAVSPCVPDAPFVIEGLDVAGSATVDGRDFFYLYAYDGPVPDNPEEGETNYEGYPSNLVISVGDGGQCRRDHFNPMNDPIPLASELSQPVARELTLSRYRNVIDAIGREGLQQRIDSWDTSGTLWDEEQWALQQLGMDIPPALLKEES